MLPLSGPEEDTLSLGLYGWNPDPICEADSEVMEDRDVIDGLLDECIEVEAAAEVKLRLSLERSKPYK